MCVRLSRRAAIAARWGQLYTRLRFADAAASATDPILALVPEDRRGTLIAHKETRGGQTVYRFDIRVQGENETVFIEV